MPTNAIRSIAFGFASAAGLVLAGPVAAQETLTVWFTKGFYKGEDDALLQMIDKFQKATGVKVDLSLYSTEDCVTKSVGAVEAGTPPDVGYCTTYDFRTTGQWAWEGKLEDVTDVIEPLKENFQPQALATTYLMHGKTGKKAYYAFPVEQQTMHITYWKDMLEEAGFKEGDIPATWDAYWDFWCDKVQGGLRAKGKRVFGIGHPLGVAASDTFYSFLTFANAYDVKIVDDRGRVILDQPANREAMIKAVKAYAAIFQRGCTPPSSVNWLDPDNNVNFHNRTTAMTHNATISIAAKHLDDMNNPALTAEQREQAKKNYYENIRTAYFPKKPDGGTLPNLAAVKTAVIFADAKNKKRAREFMAFMMKDENLKPFVEGSVGRWYPVTVSGAQSPFWTDGKDPHRAVVHKQFSDGTIPFPFVYNYKFTAVNAENVWAKAINRIIQDKVAPEQAVDEMIVRIKQIAG
ncbi:extracellular solute-binding protein [Chelatococcus sp. SYSU_G07232]|uniref:Extracellular solute-binding protein n=1 Tax=Chelatococcus albus TaxID=3047466 RepID=A0ABT7ANI4_9HYPH|nr:extracellular solute-binding protein [Chelatococcus sp. SYSU_G07232]MDJ1160121.1 extracellular solute-binding protein [Chelatococcus sp. SYSU_G07232]